MWESHVGWIVCFSLMNLIRRAVVMRLLSCYIVSTEPQIQQGLRMAPLVASQFLPHLCPPPTSQARSTQSQGPGISPSTRPDNRSMGPVLYW